MFLHVFFCFVFFVVFCLSRKKNKKQTNKNTDPAPDAYVIAVSIDWLLEIGQTLKCLLYIQFQVKLVLFESTLDRLISYKSDTTALVFFGKYHFGPFRAFGYSS